MCAQRHLSEAAGASVNPFRESAPVLAAIAAMERPGPRRLVARLIADVSALIEKRRDPAYGSLAISDAQVDELTNNLVQMLLVGDYELGE